MYELSCIRENLRIPFLSSWIFEEFWRSSSFHMKSTIMAAQIRSTKRPERRDFGKIREHIAERANIALDFRKYLKNVASKFWTSNQSCVFSVYPNSDHHNINIFGIFKSRKKNFAKLNIGKKILPTMDIQKFAANVESHFFALRLTKILTENFLKLTFKKSRKITPNRGINRYFSLGLKNSYRPPSNYRECLQWW